MSDVAEVAKGFYRAWNRHDAAAVLAAFAPGGWLSDPTLSAPVSGTGLAAYVDSWLNGFGDLQFQVKRLAVEDEWVAAQWVLRGVNSGALGSEAPTGRLVEASGADWLQVQAGQVMAVHRVFDTRGLMQQLGYRVVVQPVADEGPLDFGASVLYQAEGDERALAGAAVRILLPGDATAAEQAAVALMAAVRGVPGLRTAALHQGSRWAHLSTSWMDEESARAGLAAAEVAAGACDVVVKGVWRAVPTPSSPPSP